MPSLPFYLVERLGAPRHHHALFAQDDESGTGRTFHVTGNIQNGMEFECKKTDEPPEQSPEFVGMSLLGWVSSSDLQNVEDICRSNPPPAKQFDGPKRMDPNKALRRCQEWTAETIELLESHGVLQRAAGQGQPTQPAT